VAYGCNLFIKHQIISKLAVLLVKPYWGPEPPLQPSSRFHCRSGATVLKRHVSRPGALEPRLRSPDSTPLKKRCQEVRSADVVFYSKVPGRSRSNAKPQAALEQLPTRPRSAQCDSGTRLRSGPNITLLLGFRHRDHSTRGYQLSPPWLNIKFDMMLNLKLFQRLRISTPSDLHGAAKAWRKCQV
jgi:hypothetical protein